MIVCVSQKSILIGLQVSSGHVELPLCSLDSTVGAQPVVELLSVILCVCGCASLAGQFKGSDSGSVFKPNRTCCLIYTSALQILQVGSWLVDWGYCHHTQSLVSRAANV